VKDHFLFLLFTKRAAPGHCPPLSGPRETRIGHRSAIVFSVSTKWKWTSNWIHCDLLQFTASSAFEGFKIWV